MSENEFKRCTLEDKHERTINFVSNFSVHTIKKSLLFIHRYFFIFDKYSSIDLGFNEQIIIRLDLVMPRNYKILHRLDCHFSRKNIYSSREHIFQLSFSPYIYQISIVHFSI